jgi:signal transduction histidine kinase
MVVLAFLVPLTLVVHQLARERALADAERQTAVVVAVLTLTTDPVAVDRAIATTNSGRDGRVAVHGLAAASVGVSHAKPDEVRLAAGQRRPAVVPVAGGVAYLEPVDIGPADRASGTAVSDTAVVEVFVPDAELSRGVATAWLALIGVAVFMLVVSVLTSDRLAARVVRSARDLARAARTLGDGDLEVRVAPSGPRELAAAAVAFNTMADRLVAARAAERELIADLSHRLRTPLTALRLEAERIGAVRTADTGTTPRLSQAVEAMEHEVDTLIRTARRPSSAAEPTEPERCDAADVVRERMAFWTAVAEDQSRPCYVHGLDRRAPVGLPRSDLAAALDALLGNVFRYTPQGTAFEVAVSRRDGWVAVRVDDAGPGIADPDRALRRGTSERGSTGLGLDIARRAAVAGRGMVDIDRSALGGASVMLLLTDLDAAPVTRQRLGFVGRLSREPAERRRRRAR